MNERKGYLTSIKELFDSVQSQKSISQQPMSQQSTATIQSIANQNSRQFVSRSSIDVNQLFSIATKSNLNTNQNLVGNKYDLQSIESMSDIDRPSCLSNPKDPASFEDFGDKFIHSLQSPLEFRREPSNQELIEQLSLHYINNQLRPQVQCQQYSLNSINDTPTFDSSSYSTQSNNFQSFNLAENINFNNQSLTPPNYYLNNGIGNTSMINDASSINRMNNMILNRCSTPICNDINEINNQFYLNSQLIGQRFDNFFPSMQQSSIGNESQFQRLAMSKDLNIQSPSNTRSNGNDFLSGVELSKNDFNGEYAKEIINKAKTHRTAAQFETKAVEWRGNFENDQHRAIVYSVKVFFGGIPWDITEDFLQSQLIQYGKIKVEWPGKDVKCTFGNSPAKCGYLYVIFENPNCVAELLQKECSCEIVDGFYKYYLLIKTRRTQFKKIQVIPWILADSNWVRNSSYRLDPSKTIFVGNLHGLTTASNLATIMNAKFENVLYVGIDTDKKNYPSGSARCTFGTDESYLKAISAGFVNVISNKFNKKLQIDPYLSNSNCSICTFSAGLLFCRDLRCFKYFCVNCLYKYHETAGHVANPIMRNKKGQQVEF